MRYLMALCGIMLGLFASQPAAASDKDPCAAGMVCASKPTTIVDALQAAGFRATLSKGEDGDPKVESSAEGYKFSIFFYGCQKAELCDSLQFWISFADDGTNTPELANKWNNKRRFGQMAVSDAKSLSMSYDVTTMGGLPAKNFADVIEWWATMLGELGKFFKENGPPAPAK